MIPSTTAVATSAPPVRTATIRLASFLPIAEKTHRTVAFSEWSKDEDDFLLRAVHPDIAGLRTALVLHEQEFFGESERWQKLAIQSSRSGTLAGFSVFLSPPSPSFAGASTASP